MIKVPEDLITDRTLADVQRWAYLKNKSFENMTADEKAAWLAPQRGSYGVTDLNRVGEAVKYIAKRFRDAGYSVELKPVKTDWVRTDKPTLDQLNTYLSNITVIKQLVSSYSNIPNVPDNLRYLTHQEANDIEKILVMIDRAMTLIIASLRRCGQFTAICGGHILPVQGGIKPRNWEELDALRWGWDVWDTKTWYQLVYEEVPG